MTDLLRRIAFGYLAVGVCVASIWIVVEAIRITPKRRAGVYPQLSLITRLLAVPLMVLIWPLFLGMIWHAATHEPSTHPNPDHG